MNKLDTATNLRNNGQEEEAIKLYQELISENEKPGYCWQMIGVCYTIAKKPAEAREAIQKATELFSKENDSFNLACAYRDMGLSYLNNDQPEESLEWLKKSLETDSQPVTMGKLGLAYFKTGNSSEARKYFEEAIKGETDWFMKSTILLDFAKLEIGEGNKASAKEKILEAPKLLFPHADTQQRRMKEIEELLSKTVS